MEKLTDKMRNMNIGDSFTHDIAKYTTLVTTRQRIQKETGFKFGIKKYHIVTRKK